MTLDPAIEIDLDELQVLDPAAPLVVNTSKINPEELVLESITLEQCDIAELTNSGPSRSYATVQHTRAYHHIAALKLAAGEKAGVVAATLNLEPSTISRLLAQPQFQELVENYRNEFVNQAVNTYELMELVSMEAVGAIHERLIGEERDQIPLEALRRIGETFADRTGLSPIRRSESLNVSATGSLTDLALERVKQRHGEDAKYRPELPQQAQLEADHAEEAKAQGADISISEIFQPVEVVEVESSPSEGQGV